LSGIIYQMKKEKMDSLLRQPDLLKGISEKGISFQCYFSIYKACRHRLRWIPGAGGRTWRLYYLCKKKARITGLLDAQIMN